MGSFSHFVRALWRREGVGSFVMPLMVDGAKLRGGCCCPSGAGARGIIRGAALAANAWGVVRPGHRVDDEASGLLKHQHCFA